MKCALGVVIAMFCSSPLLAQPEYVSIAMEIDIDKPAAEVWAKVGDYCAIKDWLKFDCTIASGDGGMGTVRLLDGGRLTEIMVAQTQLSYGYTQPVAEGKYYNLYHGFMEARPVSATTSKMLYKLVLDVSNLPDQAAKDAEIAGRRARFENALRNMKEIAEAP